MPRKPRTPRVPAARAGGDATPRFLTLADVAEILSTSVVQVRALVGAGELRFIRIGGRRQYRIEAVELENYIARLYAESDATSHHEPKPTRRTTPKVAPRRDSTSDPQP